MKAKEFREKIRQMTDAEIAKQIDDNRKEIFQLRMQAQTSELKNTARIGLLRKDIARLETEKTARPGGAGHSARNGVVGDPAPEFDPGRRRRVIDVTDDPSGVEPERHHKEIDGAGVHGRAGHDEEYVPCGERMVRSDDRSFCLLGLAVCSFGIFDFFFHFYSMPHSLRHPREKCQNGYSPGTVCEGGRSSSRRVWNTR